MLKALTKIRLTSLKYMYTNSLSRGGKKVGPGRSLLYALLFLYVAGALVVMFFGIFQALAKAYAALDLGWLYFTMYAMFDFALIFIGTVFTAKAQLFEAKDNELLLSMPIKPGYILASRMIMLLVLNYIMGLLVTAPVAAAWFMYNSLDAVGIIAFVLIALLIPLFALAISALFGWLLSLLTRRVRRKSLMTTVLSLAFLLAYFILIRRANDLIMGLAMNGYEIADTLSGAAPLYWLGSAVAESNITSLLFTVLCLGLPFVLCWLILSKTFIKTVTTQRGFNKIRYVEKEHKVSSVGAALYKRELSRFTSSSIYLMNAGLGAIMIFAGGIALVIFSSKVQGIIDEMFGLQTGMGAFLAGLLTLALCMLSGTSNISSSSVSIEGRTVWINQSLPVNTETLMRTKILFHMSIVCPATLVGSVGVLIAAKPDLITALIVILLPQVFTAFVAASGLMANLRHPNLKWTNETQAVKSGIALLINMCLSWAGVIGMGIIGYFAMTKLSVTALMAIFTAFFALLTYLIYRWTVTKGTEIYEKL